MVLDVASKDTNDENVSKTISDNEKLNKTTAEQSESNRKYFLFFKLILRIPGELCYVTWHYIGYTTFYYLIRVFRFFSLCIKIINQSMNLEICGDFIMN